MAENDFETWETEEAAKRAADYDANAAKLRAKADLENAKVAAGIGVLTQEESANQKDEEGDEDATMERLGEIQDSKGFRTSWCIDDVTDMQALSRPHTYAAAHTLTYTTLRYGNRPARTVTVPIKGDCWMDLWNAAEQVVRKSCVVDHRFVEDFSQTDKPGVLIVRLGS